MIASWSECVTSHLQYLAGDPPGTENVCRKRFMSQCSQLSVWCLIFSRDVSCRSMGRYFNSVLNQYFKQAGWRREMTRKSSVSTGTASADDILQQPALNGEEMRNCINVHDISNFNNKLCARYENICRARQRGCSFPACSRAATTSWIFKS